MAGRRGQKRRNEEEKKRVKEEGEERTAMRYLLVRHIRDQPTSTLTLAIVIFPFLLEGTFIFGTCYESFVLFPPSIPDTETVVRNILIFCVID